MTPAELSHADLRLEVGGGVATITLDRPGVRNAQRPRMWAGLARILDELDESVRVVVLRGAGGTFSAGLDLSLLDPAQPDEEGNFVATLALDDRAIIDQIDVFQRPFAMLADPRFITVAVVEGHAIGAGFQLALCCDLRIATDDARFCMKEPALGLVPDLVGTKPLVAAVGYARALEICATARTVAGTEAGEIGLAQVVVPAAELDAALAATVDALTAHPHGAVSATKALLQAAPARSLDDQRLAERTAQVARFRDLAAAFAPAAGE
ncbi:enoyl-CoA hydratase/isomerase family protein [Nocardioides sp. HM23]|uniref:enoyl-CoA hydratase/isomerase family protein n=1 Tax=Nocardioides bizhenqiangii TaxID=3095076 RepID=UPI002ACAC65D|nr:enoyl-CoA hydratase/isomerase family protein [Nocardioides sp. HM23]MDZ5622475.1 enoyl-CoA hydratase/isomerase family protein [Nocardioides sp. HM23]